MHQKTLHPSVYLRYPRPHLPGHCPLSGIRLRRNRKRNGTGTKNFLLPRPHLLSQCFMGCFLCFVFSVLYLWKRDKNYDLWAACSAEVSLLFGTLVLITGAIWAKPIWGAWWVWDAQLTLTLLLWLILAAYHMLRTYIEDEVQKCAIPRSPRHYRLPQTYPSSTMPPNCGAHIIPKWFAAKKSACPPT